LKICAAELGVELTLFRFNSLKFFGKPKLAKQQEAASELEMDEETLGSSVVSLGSVDCSRPVNQTNVCRIPAD
jgi:hypothetical protein